MIQHIGGERGKDVGAWQASDVFNELPRQHNDHVPRADQADCASNGIKDESGQRHVPLAEFFRQRPHRKDTDPHGNAADHGNKGLGHSIIVGSQHIVTVVNERSIFKVTAQVEDDIVGHQNDPVLIMQYG